MPFLALFLSLFSVTAFQSISCMDRSDFVARFDELRPDSTPKKFVRLAQDLCEHELTVGEFIEGMCDKKTEEAFHQFVEEEDLPLEIIERMITQEQRLHVAHRTQKRKRLFQGFATPEKKMLIRDLRDSSVPNPTKIVKKEQEYDTPACVYQTPSDDYLEIDESYFYYSSPARRTVLKHEAQHLHYDDSRDKRVTLGIGALLKKDALNASDFSEKQLTLLRKKSGIRWQKEVESRADLVALCKTQDRWDFLRGMHELNKENVVNEEHYSPKRRYGNAYKALCLLESEKHHNE